ncbi:MAG: amidophosphoribosyltransferase [Lentisphaeria bacterium]|nr:amidophosphoribosyltransferase [Lentisphaeria bacterium]
MGGFFGVVSDHDCVSDLFYGTDYHSHLGTRRGGMAVSSSRGIYRKIHDISSVPFRAKFDSDIDSFRGNAGIGVISDTEDQPLTITSKHGTYAIVTVGKVGNLPELVSKIFAEGNAHFAESCEGEINPTELIAALINRGNDLVDGIVKAQEAIKGSCSMLILHDNFVYAARDRYGRTPVEIGRKKGAYAVSMESSAFPNLDYTFCHELGPGEIVQLSANGFEQKKAPGCTRKFCTFFWVYYGYPSSTYEGVNSEYARWRNGSSLAEGDKGMEIDSVCGIPDSGIPHAIGYSYAAGKPYLRTFVKYTPTWTRSFMPQSQKVRENIARMKLIPVKELIAGKRLLFCDDSIVRGTQLKDTVKRLYAGGAKEIHMRSACPPLLYGCPFLNFSRSRSELDLAARRAIAALEKGEITAEKMEKYKDPESAEYKAMVEYIRKELNLTTLKYQTLERLLNAIGQDVENVCTYCWNGKDIDA